MNRVLGSFWGRGGDGDPRGGNSRRGDGGGRNGGTTGGAGELRGGWRLQTEKRPGDFPGVGQRYPGLRAGNGGARVGGFDAGPFGPGRERGARVSPAGPARGPSSGGPFWGQKRVAAKRGHPFFRAGAGRPPGGPGAG